MPVASEEQDAAALKQVPGQYDGKFKGTVNKLPPIPKGKIIFLGLEKELELRKLPGENHFTHPCNANKADKIARLQGREAAHLRAGSVYARGPPHLHQHAVALPLCDLAGAQAA